MAEVLTINERALLIALDNGAGRYGSLTVGDATKIQNMVYRLVGEIEQLRDERDAFEHHRRASA